MDNEFLKKMSQEDRAELLSLAYKQYAVVSPEPVMDQWDESEEFHTMTERYDFAYRYKSCNEGIFMDNFCSKCGQRIR